MNRIRNLAVAASLVSGGPFVAAALAQPGPGKPASAPATRRIGGVSVSGSFRSRLEVWNWFDGTANDTYPFSGNILRVSFSQNRETWDWQVELAAPFLLGLPEDAIGPAPQLQFGLGGNYFSANRNRRNAIMVFPKQGFVRLKNLAGRKGLSLRVGRFEWSDGSETTPSDPALAAVKQARITQRLIGPFTWPHVGRSFDGAHFVATQGRVTWTAVGAVATRGVFQTDGWGQLKTGFVYGSAGGGLSSGRHAGDWRVYGAVYDDWRRVLKTDNRPGAARTADTDSIRVGVFGGHYLHKVDSALGPWNVVMWAAGQFGRWGAQDHRATAFNAEAGWQPRVAPALRPWISAGFAHGSGDGDPSDGRHGTFHQLLPTPRPFARFPFYNMMNNQDRFAMLTLRPNKAVTVRAEFHALRLANSRDLWYLGGGAFQPWSFGYVGRNSGGARSLANQYDTSIDWSINARVSASLYIGHAQGKAAIKAIYPRGSNGQFGYLELLYRF